MKNFPHQFNDLTKLYNALEVAHKLLSDQIPLSDENFGELLTRKGIYTYRDKTLTVDQFLVLEKEKPASNRGYLTVSRDIRKFFEIANLITLDNSKTGTLTALGNNLLAAEFDEDRNDLWRKAMLGMTLKSTSNELSHPYRILIKLVSSFPGIETTKLMLALEANNDSDSEFQRLVELSELPLSEIITRVGTTESNAANAVKILPGIAEQLGDIERKNNRSFPVNAELEGDDENTITDEDEADEIEDIISPFDPKDIKIIVEPKTIDHLVQRLKYDEIDLNTEFQRKGNLWPKEAQSRLIESILLRFPLPAFYFDAGNEDKWLVVDGLQRLWSIKNFIVNDDEDDALNSPLELKGLEILTDYSNKGITFSKLNRTMQRRILETPITTYLIQPGTPKQVKYNVFRRINTGGLGLNAMEIRNALNQGEPSKFLKNLSESSVLRSLIKVQDKRMEDRDLLLRAVSFIEKSYLDYEKPLSTFLDKAMEELENKSQAELKNLSDGIIRAIEVQKELFDKHMFSRSIMGKNVRIKLNSALFEVWVSLVYKLNDIQVSTLIQNKQTLVYDYSMLLQEEEFTRAVVSSTSGKASVKTRFEKVIELINKHIS